MEKQLTHPQAWADFWKWIRSEAQGQLWADLERKEKQYLYKADIDNRAGRLGYERTRNILTRYAPERYEFRSIVIIKQ